MAVSPPAVVGALADLAPTDDDRVGGRVVPLEWFRWLPVEQAAVFAVPESPYGMEGPSGRLVVRIDRDLAERLAAVDQVRPLERSLRIGWLFVAGWSPRWSARWPSCARCARRASTASAW